MVCVVFVVYPSIPPSQSFPANYLSFPSAGVKNFDVSLDSQTATVEAEDSLSYATVLEKIKKTGKQVNSGEMDGVPQAI
jgi:copper chaperone CopZ